METQLARTFLAVVAAGNFVSAAERLHVTQSTVSARIHGLEQQLGCILFVRNKAGTTPTPVGRQFQKHAGILVRTVEHARHDVGVPRAFRAALTVGGRFGLWEQLLLPWLPLMREMAPDISLRAEIGMEPDLMQGLVEGRLDIGVMYTPQKPSPPHGRDADRRDAGSGLNRSSERRTARSRLCVYRLGAGILCQAQRELSRLYRAGFDGEYWLGWPAAHSREWWIRVLPVRLVRPCLADGRLVPLEGAPKISLPAYMVYASEDCSDFLDQALQAMRDIAEKEKLEVDAAH